jgi:hypothetical protein
MFDCPYDVMALLMVTVSLLPPTLFEQVAEQLAVELSHTNYLIDVNGY